MGVEIVSGDNEVVSPELALVDAALAARARPELAEPRAPVRARLSQPTVMETAVATPRLPASERGGDSWRLLIGVAAVTIAALLLFDVRVEVGEEPGFRRTGDVGQGPRTVPSSPRPAAQAPSPSSRPRQPARPARPSPRRFAWAPTAGATGYHVEFFRGDDSRLCARARPDPELTVPARWTYGGAERVASPPGEYRWYVWPIVSGRRESRAAVQTTVSIPRN